MQYTQEDGCGFRIFDSPVPMISEYFRQGKFAAIPRSLTHLWHKRSY